MNPQNSEYAAVSGFDKSPGGFSFSAWRGGFLRADENAAKGPLSRSRKEMSYGQEKAKDGQGEEKEETGQKGLRFPLAAIITVHGAAGGVVVMAASRPTYKPPRVHLHNHLHTPAPPTAGGSCRTCRRRTRAAVRDPPCACCPPPPDPPHHQRSPYRTGRLSRGSGAAPFPGASRPDITSNIYTPQRGWPCCARPMRNWDDGASAPGFGEICSCPYAR